MVAGAAQLIATGGVEAMSLRELAGQAQIPLGSMYHHFPGGKAQLVDEAVLLVGARITRLLDEARERGPEHALRSFADTWRTILEASDFRSGCPVVAAATANDPRHHAVAREVFGDWHRSLIQILVDDGVDPGRAPRLARTIVATIEGAVGLARAAGSADPLDEVVEELAAVIAAAGVAPATRQ
jgi:TetR/AcrR family transcriptional repressor of lmrAB and yxaGH operons